MSQAYLTDELCKVYRLANLRFPQAELGIVPTITHVMLSHGCDYLRDALTLDFSPAQVASIRVGMNRAHQTLGIPALGPDALAVVHPGVQPDPMGSVEGIRLIDDDRIRSVWRNIVFYTMDAIVDCIRAARPTIGLEQDESLDGYRQLALDLPARFARDRELFDLVSALYAAVVDALESAEALELATRFRHALQFESVQQGRKVLPVARREFQEGVVRLMLTRIDGDLEPFVPLFESRSWRVFRPLIGG